MFSCVTLICPKLVSIQGLISFMSFWIFPEKSIHTQFSFSCSSRKTVTEEIKGNESFHEFLHSIVYCSSSFRACSIHLHLKQMLKLLVFHVDASGVLRTRIIQDQNGSLMRQLQAAAKNSQKADLAKQSTMRKVSLNRLEAAIQECISQGRPVSEEMMNLAGLQRLQYVFYYPETKDIVIAGPAEGFFTSPTGRIVGLTSLQPTLRLEDLVVALRAAVKETGDIGCSIDPTANGLAKLNQYLASNST